ncbi:MAG: cytochrome c family protein [Pseudomonadota bacterium]
MKKAMSGLAIALATSLIAGSAMADGDVKKGEKVFKRCKACHKVEDGKNGVGPHLFGIVGRAVAGVEDYKYSKAMDAYGANGEVWDAERLDRYLTKPKKEVKGTKMAFAGLKKEKQRVDLQAYLETLK